MSYCRSVLALVLLARSAAGVSGHEIPIPALQGRGHRSPCVGRNVTTSGVITAVSSDGFYLQDPQGDGDPATSDAVFVRSGRAASLAPGAAVRVTGVVAERIPGGASTANLSTTELLEPSHLEVLAGRRPVPGAVLLGRGGRSPPARRVVDPANEPVDLRRDADARRYRFDPGGAGLDYYESLEGMLVTVPAPAAVSATRRYGPAAGEVFTVSDRGAGVEPPTARGPRGNIFLQPDPDDRGDQNPEIVQLQFSPGLYRGPLPSIGVGDQLADVTGVMDYDYGAFEVRALAPVRSRPAGLRPETTRLGGTDSALTIGTYNVLNLSATPDDSVQRRRLGGQIAANLRSPDVLALQEIQDNNGETDDGTTDASGTLAALVQSIVAAGGPRYASFDVAPADGTLGGAPGGNIRVALLYNPARVRLLSAAALKPDALARAGVRDSAAFRNSRDPLVAVLEFGGRRLTVIANHLTSRYGSTPAFGAIQPFVQAGAAARRAQARALHDYVARLLRLDPKARVVVLGDLNTFEFTTELASTLPGPDPILTNLLSRERPAERYTYNYLGNSQALDHIFVTAPLLARAELDVVHVNVDFPDTHMVEASDHEPVVARVE